MIQRQQQTTSNRSDALNVHVVMVDFEIHSSQSCRNSSSHSEIHLKDLTLFQKLKKQMITNPLKPKNHTFKILIIGGSQVGKYSLACSFSKFKNLKGYAELISFVSNVISFDHVQITGHVFMDPADGVIHVLDVSQTCQSNREEFHKWNLFVLKGLVKDNALHVVVGNKNDLSNEERRMTFQEGQKLAKELNYPYVETSAWSPNSFHVFEMMLQKIYTRQNERTNPWLRSTFVINESNGRIMKVRESKQHEQLMTQPFKYQKKMIIVLFVIKVVTVISVFMVL
ncbi:hypothetical protein FDP41_013040 [Naegleria fowleri]|uniref:Uncharacterized protein n=1 Tax=Naegleria fowleri TaxID=5763 RepID=A0A6A5C3C9_NAEFO|nr:uncharacterized protein FDP41_013040 [Naegleria fowleri]KAF0981252.1 hypothetical protein FDP41_013040 [Naegleria fowleri]